jgi:hypothetical protein
MSTLNLNQRATARLTETGLRILDEYEADLGLPERHRRASVSDGNLWSGQLWSLMQEFGPSISMGMGESAFVDNRIDVEALD